MSFFWDSALRTLRFAYVHCLSRSLEVLCCISVGLRLQPFFVVDTRLTICSEVVFLELSDFVGHHVVFVDAIVVHENSFLLIRRFSW